MLFATAACKFWTSEQQKVLQTPHVLKILTSKCAFRHRGVHFFNIRTYKSCPNTSCLVHPDYLFDLSGAPFFRIRCLKSGPKLTCFVHFYFKMWFSPQRRAILAHQNCKKCSETAVFCTCSLPNVPFATGACIFSTSELTKVVQTRHV